MKTRYEEIGKMIKQARMNRGLSQKDLAGKLGVTASLINQFEKGGKKPRLIDAFRIEELLKVERPNISQGVINAEYFEATGQKRPEQDQTLKTAVNVGEVAGGAAVIKVPVKMPREIYLKLEFE